jgi:endo-1,4-beta-D-glucanase Y
MIAEGVLASRRSVMAAGLATLLHPLPPALAVCRTWQAWDDFARNFLADSGRLIDPSTYYGQTTSEGQAYALFFALVADDRSRFAAILRWTENNLCAGDLSAHLPAWQWGRKADGSYAVIDANPAADADLWIAYTLQEAGRLWRLPRYVMLGQQVAERILAEETAVMDGLGRLLLPAPAGFLQDAGHARFNPSYVPLQLLRRLADGSVTAESTSGWQEIERNALRMIIESAPRGFVPDWIGYTAGTGFGPVASGDGAAGIGSFNAIRTYLWAGMLAADTPDRARLLTRLRPMADLAITAGAPPERIDTRSGAADGTGDAGFSAALLPLIDATAGRHAATLQRARITARDPLARRDNYYEQALTLFGLGWADGVYRFAPDGQLRLQWPCSAR